MLDHDRVPSPSEEPIVTEAEAYIRRTEKRLARRPYYRVTTEIIGGTSLALAVDGTSMRHIGWAGTAVVLTGMVRLGVESYRSMVRYEESLQSPIPHPENF